MTIVKFNASTGSDTLSSGAGPDDPINGSGASLNATTTVDLSADSPDLSSIATDGTAVLWVQTTTGRQFSKITGVDNSLKTVTVSDTYGVTESGKIWAIGGKRATWDNSNSRTLFASDGEEFLITTETDQSLTSELDISVRCTIAGSGGIKTVDQSADAANFGETTISNLYLANLKFTNSNGSSTANSRAYHRNGHILAYNCIFGDSTNQLYYAIEHKTGRTSYFLTNCVVQYCIGDGVRPSHSICSGHYTNCIFHSNGGSGVNVGDNSLFFRNCVFANNTTHGLKVTNANTIIGIDHCVFYNNGSDGYNGYLGHQSMLINSAFYGNTGNGVNALASSNNCLVFGNFAQSSETYTNFSIGSDVTTLTADIFVDETADIFNLNTNAGGGAELIEHNFDYGTAKTRPFRWLDVSRFARSSINPTVLKSFAKLTIKGN